MILILLGTINSLVMNSFISENKKNDSNFLFFKKNTIIIETSATMSFQEQLGNLASLQTL